MTKDNLLKLVIGTICSVVILAGSVVCYTKYKNNKLNISNNTSLNKKLSTDNKKPLDTDNLDTDNKEKLATRSKKSNHESSKSRCLVDVRPQQLRNSCWIASANGFLRYYGVKVSSSDAKALCDDLHYNPKRFRKRFPKCCRRSMNLDYFNPKDDLAMMRMQYEYKSILSDILNKNKQDLSDLPADEDIRTFYQEIKFILDNKTGDPNQNLEHIKNIIEILEGKECSQDDISTEQMLLINAIIRRARTMLENKKLNFNTTSDVAAMEFLRHYNEETKIIDTKDNPKKWSCVQRNILIRYIKADTKGLKNIEYFTNDILNSTDGEVSDVIEYINRKVNFPYGVKSVDIVPIKGDMIYPDELFEVIKREMKAFDEPEPMIFLRGRHFIVIEDIGENSGMIYYADPLFKGKHVHREEKFVDFWWKCMSASWGYGDKTGEEGSLNMYTIIRRRVDKNDKDIKAYQD